MPARLLEEVRDALARDPALYAEAQAQLERELRGREIFFGDNLLPTYLVPFLIREADRAAWIRQSEELAEGIEAVAQRALEDPALWSALHLRPDAQELVRIDPGYRRICVLTRPDAVPTGGGALAFLEYNSDSPAMMAFSDVLSEILPRLPHLAPLAGRLGTERMTDRLLEVLLACYREAGGPAQHPTIAIVDWAGQKTRYEHRRIAAHFEAAGSPTVVCDPRELSRPGRRLELNGRAIDLVYRRALFTELLERQAEVAPLLSAYRDGAIVMVNPLRSYLAASKSLLALLCGAAEGPASGLPAALLDGLPESVRRAGRHAAPTAMVTPERAAALVGRPLTHVLKRSESHGGMHVLLPQHVTDADWQRGLDDAQVAPWIMQTLLEVPQLSLPTADGDAKGNPVRWAPKYYNWNPFLFGGRYAGGMARASDTPLINISLGGGLLPTMTI